MTEQLSVARILEIRDALLPSQGEPFDCVAFAVEIVKAERGRANGEKDAQHAAGLASWHSRWAHLPADVQDACADADDPLSAGIDELRRRLSAAHQQLESSEAAARADAAKHDATVRKLTEWLADVGLLHYHAHCTRPDRTHGPMWVLREPATVNGGSCEAWSPKSADACIAGFFGPNQEMHGAAGVRSI